MKTLYIKEIAVRKRLFWLKEAQRLGVNRACLKLGIYKSHFYYWKRRFDAYGIDGLSSRSRRPLHSPRLSQNSLVRNVKELRSETKRGADTIALLLDKRLGQKVSRSTINKILKREGLIQKPKRPPRKKHRLRYQSKRPGDRVQIDVKYVPYRIKDGLLGRAYQYTAIDDCTRIRFAWIYPGHGIYYLKDFLARLTRFFPFPIKLIQTDNDVVFTFKYTSHRMAFKTEPKEHYLTTFCRENGIKHHLIQPGEPQLNGKVERSHRTDNLHFYNLYRYKWVEPLRKAFATWVDYYNHQRPHWGIKGQTPIEKLQRFGYQIGRITNELTQDLFAA